MFKVEDGVLVIRNKFYGQKAVFCQRVEYEFAMWRGQVDAKKRILGDGIAVIFIATIALLVLWLCRSQFIAITLAYPFWMGSSKFGVLGTFGSQLKTRLKTGEWHVRFKEVVGQVIVWMIIGWTITGAFKIFSMIVEKAVVAAPWLVPIEGTGRIWLLAFYKSTLINGAYAFWMMFAHEWLDRLYESLVIKKEGFLTPARAWKNLDHRMWKTFGWFTIPLQIIVWWWPVHTYTFSNQFEWQIIIAAALSIVLAVFITIGASPGKKK